MRDGFEGGSSVGAGSTAAGAIGAGSTAAGDGPLAPAGVGSSAMSNQPLECVRQDEEKAAYR
jgi:hypothetical protein